MAKKLRDSRVIYIGGHDVVSGLQGLEKAPEARARRSVAVGAGIDADVRVAARLACRGPAAAHRNLTKALLVLWL